MKAKYMSIKLTDAALLEIIEKVQSMIDELESLAICPDEMYEIGTDLLTEKRTRGLYMPRYVEFQCENTQCLHLWEAFVSVRDDGDGGYEYVACSDGPATAMLTNKCPDCGEQGEEL